MSRLGDPLEKEFSTMLAPLRPSTRTRWDPNQRPAPVISTILTFISLSVGPLVERKGTVLPPNDCSRIGVGRWIF